MCKCVRIIENHDEIKWCWWAIHNICFRFNGLMNIYYIQFDDQAWMSWQINGATIENGVFFSRNILGSCLGFFVLVMGINDSRNKEINEGNNSNCFSYLSKFAMYIWFRRNVRGIDRFAQTHVVGWLVNTYLNVCASWFLRCLLDS